MKIEKEKNNNLSSRLLENEEKLRNIENKKFDENIFSRNNFVLKGIEKRNNSDYGISKNILTLPCAPNS